MTTPAQRALAHGADFPYDGGEEFWTKIDVPPPPAVDWAHRAARGVLADLTDRQGVKHELSAVDYDVREELTDSIAAIIREAGAAR